MSLVLYRNPCRLIYIYMYKDNYVGICNDVVKNIMCKH